MMLLGLLLKSQLRLKIHRMNQTIRRHLNQYNPVYHDWKFPMFPDSRLEEPPKEHRRNHLHRCLAIEAIQSGKSQLNRTDGLANYRLGLTNHRHLYHGSQVDQESKCHELQGRHRLGYRLWNLQNRRHRCLSIGLVRE